MLVPAALLALLAACHETAPSAALTRPLALPPGDAGPPRTHAPTLATSSADAEAPRASGHVVVSIVVDQLAAWVVEERLPALPSDGGFARLAREGTRVRRMAYAHAVTDTAPGHASLYTGLTPARTGIFGNEVFGAATATSAPRPRVSILRDGDTELVGAAKLGRPGSSARRLAAPTVTEELLAARPDARALSISWKDRGAILPAGRVSGERAVVMWFDAAADTFVTSTAFAPALPPFALAELTAHPASGFRASPWTPLDAPWLAAHATTKDDAPGEGDLEGLGTAFPHAISNAKAMRATPASDAMVLSMALAGLAAPASGPRLLLLSLSANDYVGHVFGPDSWEAWDELRRLDRALAAFFTELDARFGASGWSAVLSADHGTVPLPETLADRAGRPAASRPPCGSADPYQRPCHGTRILPDELGARLRKVSSAVVGICDPWVFFTDAVRADPRARAEAEARVVAALAKEPGVARAFTASWLAAHCGQHANVSAPEGHATLETLVCASWSAGAGDIYVLPREGAFFDPLQVVGRGMSHGSPYPYDRAVPLFVRSRGKVAEGRVVEAASFEAFRASLGALLELGRPPAFSAP